MREGDILTGYNPQTAFDLKLDTLKRMDPILNQKEYNVPDYNNQQPSVSLEDALTSGDGQLMNMAANEIIRHSSANPWSKYKADARITIPKEMGEKFVNKKFGYDILRDNEDYYYQNEYMDDGFLWRNTKNILWRFPSRVLSGVVNKLGEGFGYLGRGIFELGDEAISKVFGYENNAWADIADNSFSVMMKEADQNFRDYIVPVYKQAGFDEKGFFSKLTDWTFWNDSVADGVSFLVSAFVPMGAASKVGLLTKGASAFSKINNLTRGTLGAVTGAETMGELGMVAFNVANEAAFEAAETFRNTKQKLIEDRNNGKNSLTNSQINEEAGKKASSVFGWNTAMLGFSQGFEMKNIYKPLLGKFKNADNIIKGVHIDDFGKAGLKEVKNKFVNKLINNRISKDFGFYGKKLVQGTLTEGYWEENMQLAITRATEGEYERKDSEGIEDIKTEGGILGILEQFARQTRDSATWLGGKGDIEASESIGLGGLIGLIGGGIGSKLGKRIDPITGKESFTLGERKQKENQKLKLIADINNARNNLFSIKDVYNQDGSINVDKLKTKLEAMEDFAYKQDIIDKLKDNPNVTKEEVDMFENRLLNDYVKNIAKTNQLDSVIDRFQNFKADETSQLVNNPIEKAAYVKRVSELYQNIMSKNITEIKPNDLTQNEVNSIDQNRKDRAFDLMAERFAIEPLLSKYQNNLSETKEEFINNIQNNLFGEDINRTLGQNRSIDYIEALTQIDFYEEMLKKSYPPFMQKYYEQKIQEAKNRIAQLDELTKEGKPTIKGNKIETKNPFIQGIINEYDKIYKSSAILTHHQEHNNALAAMILDPKKGMDNWREYVKFIEETQQKEEKLKEDIKTGEVVQEAEIVETPEEEVKKEETSEDEVNKEEEEKAEKESEVIKIVSETENEEVKKLEEERDNKLKPLIEERDELLKEIERIEKELEGKSEEEKQKDVEEQEEKNKPTEKEEKILEEATKSTIENVLSEEEKEVVAEVFEENKKEGQTQEQFVAEKVAEEVQGKPLNLKGDKEKVSKFKKILRKIAKLFAFLGIFWITANPIANFLNRNDIVSREKTTFVLDLLRVPQELTEDSFNKEQKDMLLTIIKKAESQGRNYVTYTDYPNEYKGAIRAKTDTTDVTDSSPEMVIKRTLGQFNFKKLPDGRNYLITDKYNFNDAGGKSFSEKVDFIIEGFKDGGLSAYGKIRRIGTAFGSEEGRGADTIVILENKPSTSPIAKMGIGLLGLGLIGGIRKKREDGEPITNTDLEKLRERLQEVNDEIEKITNEYEQKIKEIQPVSNVVIEETIPETEEGLVEFQQKLEDELIKSEEDSPVVEQLEEAIEKVETKLKEIQQEKEQEKEEEIENEQVEEQKQNIVVIEEVVDDPKTYEVNLTDPLIWESPAITSKSDTISINDKDEKVWDKTDTEKFSPDDYNLLRAEFIQKIITKKDFNDNYDLFIVNDTYQRVYKNTLDSEGNPVIPTGEVIIVRKKDGTDAIVSDFFKGYKEYKNEPIIFSFDKGMFFRNSNGLYDYRVSIKSQKYEISIEEADKANREIESVMNEARNFVKANPNAAVPVSISGISFGINPVFTIVPVAERFGEFDFEVVIPTVEKGKTSNQFKGKFPIGTVVAKLEAGINIPVFTMRLDSDIEMLQKVEKTLQYKFDTYKEAEKVRNDFLSQIINTNDNQYFRIEKDKETDKYRIVFYKLNKKGEAVESNAVISQARFNVSVKALKEGWVIFNPENGQFEGEDNIDYKAYIKSKLVTNRKKILDKKGKLTDKLVNPYFSFIIDTSLFEQKKPEDTKKENYNKINSGIDTRVKNKTFNFEATEKYIRDNKSNLTEEDYNKLLAKIETYRPKPVQVFNYDTLREDVERRRKNELIKGDLPNVPDYAKEEIDRIVKANNNLLIKIVNISLLDKTKAEVAKELNIDKEVVNSIRAYLQIPSMDDKTEFQQWKDKIRKINAKYDAEIERINEDEELGIEPTNPEDIILMDDNGNIISPAPVVTPASVVTPNVENSSDIEAKKADIERRRQKELKEAQRQFDVRKRGEEKRIKLFEDKLVENPNGAEALDGTYQYNLDLAKANLEKILPDFENRNKEINAKYDAELKVLESPEQKISDFFTFNNFNYSKNKKEDGSVYYIQSPVNVKDKWEDIIKKYSISEKEYNDKYKLFLEEQEKEKLKIEKIKQDKTKEEEYWNNNTNNIVGQVFQFNVGEDEKGLPYNHKIRINKLHLLEDGNYRIIGYNTINGNTYDIVTSPDGSIISYTRDGKVYSDNINDEILFTTSSFVKPAVDTQKAEELFLEMLKGKRIVDFTIEEQQLINSLPLQKFEEIKAKFEEGEYAKSEVSLEQKQDMEPTKQENKSSRGRFAGKKKNDVSAIIAGKDKSSSVKMIYETSNYTYNPETNSITKKDGTKLNQAELFTAMEELKNKYPYTATEEGNTGFDYLEIGEFKIFGLPTTTQNSEIIFNSSNLQITKGNDWIMDKLEGVDKTRFEQFLKRYC